MAQRTMAMTGTGVVEDVSALRTFLGTSWLLRVLGAFRLWSGSLWWENQAWKTPWHPDGAFGCGPGMIERIGQAANPNPRLTGLCDWINHELFVPNSPFGWSPLNKWLIQTVVAPNFVPFAWFVWAGELFVALTFFLGAFTRLGALVALALTIHLFVGLATSPREWYWSYLLMLMLNVIFLVGNAGRTFGLDAWIAPRFEALAKRGGIWKLTGLLGTDGGR